MTWILRVAVGVSVMGLLAGCNAGADREKSSTTSAAVDSEAEKAAAFAQLKKETLAFLRITNPPDVTPVRWITPDETQETSDACMASQGFVADSAGNVMINGREDANKRATYVCTLRYPVLPRYGKSWTQEQKAAQYDWVVNYEILCLKANGVILSHQVPSKAEFVDTWGTADAYWPTSELSENPDNAKITPGANHRLERECPQNAPSAIIWDGMTVAQWAAAHPIRTSPAPPGK